MPSKKPPRGYPEHWGPICKKIIVEAERATIVLTAIATVFMIRTL